MSESLLAREFVPESYSHWPMVRLFLPLHDDDDIPHRWSKFLVDGFELTGSISWWEVWDRWVAERGQSSPELTPARGWLDTQTAGPLRDALSLQLDPTTALTCHRWDGYGDERATDSPASIERNGHTFLEFASTIDHRLQPHSQPIPEFIRDRNGLLAWGTHLYPDSLVIASEPSIYRALINDARVDTVTIRKETDFLPPSSGD